MRDLRRYIDADTGCALFANPVCGKLLSKQSLSHWLMEVISIAYKRGVAMSWALFRGVSVEDICAVASWASPCTFVWFY